jgi:AcrR family transcriptional regulator
VNRVGRPTAADPARRRRDILLAARRRFAFNGYAATSLTAVAVDSGITLTALYRYFPDKQALYEAVFDDCFDAIWTDVHERSSRIPPEEYGFDDMIAATREADLHVNDSTHAATRFLTAVPVDASRHSELEHLLDRRAERQRDQLRKLLEAPLACGALGPVPSLEVAVTVAQILVMGWGIENHFQRTDPERLQNAVEHILTALRFVDLTAVSREDADDS